MKKRKQIANRLRREINEPQSWHSRQIEPPRSERLLLAAVTVYGGIFDWALDDDYLVEELRANYGVSIHEAVDPVELFGSVLELDFHNDIERASAVVTSEGNRRHWSSEHQERFGALLAELGERSKRAAWRFRQLAAKKRRWG